MSGDDRTEIERIKTEMRRTQRMEQTVDGIKRWTESGPGRTIVEGVRAIQRVYGSPENRRIALQELEAEGWQRAAAPEPPVAPAIERPRLRVLKRPAGRPQWTREKFWQVYRQAREDAGPDAGDKEIAEHFGRGLQQLQRLQRRFGLPDDGLSE